MKFATREIVRLLKPRLGFGLAEPRPEPEPTPDPTPVADIPVPTAPRIERLEDPTQNSLVRLAEQLNSTIKEAPEEARAKASENLKELAGLFAIEPPKPPERIVEVSGRKSLEGCRVGAIGFGRQDIAGIASSMMERRARVQFMPRGITPGPADFDLLVLNGASLESLKRDADQFRSVLESGVPAILVGSRGTLNMLKDCGDPRTWDFIAKPVHMDELAWRAENLLARQRVEDKRLPAHIVIADHDPFTRSLVESAMAQLGIASESVDEGDTAWAAIEKSRPGAVILDLTLPNRDGFQLMADIRRSNAVTKPKIIVLSARQSEADIMRAFSLGADDYITKPFSPLELGARLVRLLGGPPQNA